MAFVQVAYTYAEGGQLSVTIKARSDYPDAIDEARMQAVRGFKEALGELAREAQTD
mgnify:CR=1 FL=1